jgi:hypothetical protein
MTAASVRAATVDDFRPIGGLFAARQSGPWKASLGSEYYGSHDIGGMNAAYIRPSLAYSAAPWLNLAAAYRYQISRAALQRPWTDQHRAEFIAEPHAKWGRGLFSDANKLERRWLEGSFDRWIYRNALKIALTVSWRGWNFVPFVQHETFYDTYLHQTAALWDDVGFSKALGPGLSATIFYRIESARTSAGFKRYNGLGLWFSLESGK